MKKKVRDKKGITLIALIVTIIILIILAAVSINLIFGNSGIIKRARESVNKYDVARTKEIIEMERTSYYADAQGNNSLQGLINYLSNNSKFDFKFSIDGNSISDGAMDIGDNEETYVILNNLKFKINKQLEVIYIDYIENIENPITAQIEANKWVGSLEENMSIRGKLSSKSGSIKKVEIKKPDGNTEDITNLMNENGEFLYEALSDGTYTVIVTDIANNNAIRNVNLAKTIDNIPPAAFNPSINVNGNEIAIAANSQDSESGIAYYKYTILKNSSVISEGTFTESEANINVTSYGEYDVVITAYDKAGNSKASEPSKVALSIQYVNNGNNLPVYGMENGKTSGFSAWWQYNTSSEVSTSQGITRCTKYSEDTGGQVGGVMTSNFINYSGYDAICFAFDTFSYTGNEICFEKTESGDEGYLGSYGLEPGHSDSEEIAVIDEFRSGDDYFVICKIPSSGRYRFGFCQWAGEYDIKIKQVWLAKLSDPPIAMQYVSGVDLPIYGLSNSRGGSFSPWWEYRTDSQVTTSNGVAHLTKYSEDTGGQVGGAMTSRFIKYNGYRKICFVFEKYTYNGNEIEYNITDSDATGSMGSYGFEPGINGTAGLWIIDKYWVGNNYYVICSIPKSGEYRFGLFQWAGEYDVKLKQVWLTNANSRTY